MSFVSRTPDFKQAVEANAILMVIYLPKFPCSKGSCPWKFIDSPLGRVSHD